MGHPLGSAPIKYELRELFDGIRFWDTSQTL